MPRQTVKKVCDAEDKKDVQEMELEFPRQHIHPLPLSQKEKGASHE